MTEEVEVNQTPAAEPEPEPAVEPQVEVDSGEPVSISVETHVALFASVKETVFVCWRSTRRGTWWCQRDAS